MSSNKDSKQSGSGYPQHSEAQDARLFALGAEGDPVEAPETERAQWVNSGLKFIIGNIGAFLVFKALDCFVALSQKKPGCLGQTAKQKQQIQLQVDQLAKLPDGEVWTKLAGWVSTNKPTPTPPSQYETVSFLMRARQTDSDFSMSTADKVAQINKLAGMQNDADMYTAMSSFTYGGQACPFSYGALLVLKALLKKYPNDFHK
jgi:hypothetical protein